MVSSRLGSLSHVARTLLSAGVPGTFVSPVPLAIVSPTLNHTLTALRRVGNVLILIIILLQISAIEPLNLRGKLGDYRRVPLFDTSLSLIRVPVLL